MSARVSAAERAALPVARAALESQASGYGVSDAIVFALGAAGLLMSPEVAAELARLRAGVVPLAEDRFAEIRARVEAAEDGWHIVTDPDEPYRFEIHGDGPTTVAVFGGDSYPVRENALFAAHARADVPALLAEVDRLRAERHSTNEALSDAAEALRTKEARIAELEQQLAAARDAAAEAVMCGDGDCLVSSHLPKIERALGGVGLMESAPGAVTAGGESL
jgi:hypothetical protein